MIESIAQIKKGKSADHDKITPEMLKNLDPRGLLKLVLSWQYSRKETNYRGITVLRIVSKAYERKTNNYSRKHTS